MTPMFSVQNGIPIWALETGLDIALQDVRKEVYTEIFPLPDGIVMSLMAYIYDDPKQPLIFHQILDLSDHENRYFFNYYCDGELDVVFVSDGAGHGDITHTLTPADKCARFAAVAAPYFDGSRDMAPGGGEAQYREIAARNIANKEFAGIWDVVEAQCIAGDELSAQAANSTPSPSLQSRQAQIQKDIQRQPNETGHAISRACLTVLVPVAGGGGLAYMVFKELMPYIDRGSDLFFWTVGWSGLFALGLLWIWRRSFKYMSRTITDIRSVPEDIMRAYNKSEIVKSNAKLRFSVTLAGVCGGFSLWYLLVFLSLFVNAVVSPHFGWDDLHILPIIGGLFFSMILFFGGVSGILYTLLYDEES